MVQKENGLFIDGWSTLTKSEARALVRPREPSTTRAVFLQCKTPVIVYLSFAYEGGSNELAPKPFDQSV